jgi:hypothetical protein
VELVSGIRQLDVEGFSNEDALIVLYVLRIHYVLIMYRNCFPITHGIGSHGYDAPH